MQSGHEALRKAGPRGPVSLRPKSREVLCLLASPQCSRNVPGEG